MPTGWTPEVRDKYKQSREWHAAYLREWRKKNLEKCREKDREYYHRVIKHKTPSTYTAKHKNYNRKNREKINAKKLHIYHTNRSKHFEYQKKWQAANPDKVHAMRKRSKLKAKYGITLEQFDEMYALQKGKCANKGCNIHGSSRGKGSLVVDHCHKTGKVRGLLCIGCNFALGSLNDSTKRAIGLATYLRSGKFNAI